MDGVSSNSPVCIQKPMGGRGPRGSDAGVGSRTGPGQFGSPARLVHSDLVHHPSLTKNIPSLFLVLPLSAATRFGSMVKTHERSPDSADAGLVKRLKTAAAASTAVEDDVEARFSDGLLAHTTIARLNNMYRNSQPFHYALVEKLFQDDLLKRVKDECVSELSFTEKETDIYKVCVRMWPPSSCADFFAFSRSNRRATLRRSTTLPPSRSRSSRTCSPCAMPCTPPNFGTLSAPSPDVVLSRGRSRTCPSIHTRRVRRAPSPRRSFAHPLRFQVATS